MRILLSKWTNNSPILTRIHSFWEHFDNKICIFSCFLSVCIVGCVQFYKVIYILDYLCCSLSHSWDCTLMVAQTWTNREEKYKIFPKFSHDISECSKMHHSLIMWVNALTDNISIYNYTLDKLMGEFEKKSVFSPKFWEKNCIFLMFSYNFFQERQPQGCGITYLTRSILTFSDTTSIYQTNNHIGVKLFTIPFK